MNIKMFRRMVVISLLSLAFLGSFLLAGCARHPSPEQLSQLENTKAAALAAEKEAEAKKQERMEWEGKLQKKQQELKQAEDDLKAVQQAVAQKQK